MLKYYPSDTVLKNKFLNLCGQHYGIMESQILTSSQGKYTPRISVCTANMPAYHKAIIHEKAEINHHLSGYGVYFEEAMVRLLGEGIERYALLLANGYYQDKQIKASYNDIHKYGEAMPWEYMMMYSDEDYRKLAQHTNVRPITKDDPISWIRCPSVFDPNREIYIPAQLMFTGFNNLADEKLFSPGFSKGAAAHTTLKNALKSALMESVEADAFSTGWYAKTYARRLIVDDENMLNLINQSIGDIDCEVFPFEYSLPDMPGYSVGVALLSNHGKRPAVVVGCQTDLNAGKALYKALLEALAIYYLATNGPLLIPDLYLKKVENNSFNNLDTNVALWANPENYEKKKDFFYSWCQDKVLLSSLESQECESVDDEISGILTKLRKKSSYGVYLDITPPEVQDKGWKVLRTFFPELVQMCLPSFPYSNHPRIREFGGVKNDLPHPVP
ncbi:MAG: YcaO-like family protein [Clostridia bacterium]|nr:YcaO-like family protein [Clostridia bacterium]